MLFTFISNRWIHKTPKEECIARSITNASIFKWKKKYTDRSFALRFLWSRIFYNFIPFPPNCCQESFYFTPGFRHTMDFNNNHRGKKKEWSVKFRGCRCPLPRCVHQGFIDINRIRILPCSVHKNPVFLLTVSFPAFSSWFSHLPLDFIHQTPRFLSESHNLGPPFTV